MKKQLFLYPINIEPMEEGGYFSECPILQGCHAEGDTFGKAIDNLQDVIRVHLQVRIKHGDFVPAINY
ncbi:MAG: HicB family protein [Candidatus Portnoybacteria bacterium CG23_combo_of_CG06-09_8_20_14_all_37_13]|uniref:HicB family protein n=1 Tax=Candidatus Portnoybacteria bacterium CG23_combo_of_CG06-09_8_20_14_all_37_13 TaxID=1974819 RepID=A0A2G9YCJ5_9BACT|nr:MAG: HicB family protein [Candidatus Portnoybacteria bacterium CG23_combo_of_CG06-09_8_20_14_all_37_13]